jgi:hypothetical protein
MDSQGLQVLQSRLELRVGTPALSLGVVPVSSGAGSRRDSYEVCTEILGLSDEEFIDLMQQGMFE